MTSEKGNFNGLLYKIWRPSTPSNNYVVVAQGSGEFTRTTDGSDLDNFIDKGSYASYCLNGKEYPFNVLTAASYKAPGATGNPTQVAIKRNLADLVMSFNPTFKILTGYSYGGQLAAGYLCKSLNGDQTETSYIGSDIWDGYIIMAAGAPAIPDYCAHPDKPVLIIHGDADTAIGIGTGRKLFTKLNECTTRINKAQMIEIPGGSHSSSWTKGYNTIDPVGKIAYELILSIFNGPIPEIPLDSIVLKGQDIIATFGDKKYRLSGTSI